MELDETACREAFHKWYGDPNNPKALERSSLIERTPAPTPDAELAEALEGMIDVFSEYAEDFEPDSVGADVLKVARETLKRHRQKEGA